MVLIAETPSLWLTDARNYRVHMPHDTTIKASCEDVGCDQRRSGWETVCDESTRDGVMVANWIRSGQSGRDFTEMSDVRQGSLVAVFRFPPHQRCFTEHRTRPGRLLVQRRGRVLREHSSLSDLAEDYTEHVGRLAEQEERG